MQFKVSVLYKEQAVGRYEGAPLGTFQTLSQCFDATLAEVEASGNSKVILCSASKWENQGSINDEIFFSAEKYPLIYQSNDENSTWINNLNIPAGRRCILIQQLSGKDCEFSDFSSAYRKYSFWRLNTILSKIFHPGNSLTVAFGLLTVGLALGSSCPPMLIFVALGIAAFSAISAIGYAINWLNRDYSLYKIELNEKIAKEGDIGREVSLRDYLSQYPSRLYEWAGKHPIQATFMALGFALFMTALVITVLAFTGGLAAVPVLAGFIGGIGASGTALGTIGAVFSGALGSSAIATTLASIFAGATLILAPVNILDTIRRFVSGVYDFLVAVPSQASHQPPNLPHLHPQGFILGPSSDQLNQQKEKLKPGMTNDEVEKRKAKYSDVLQKKDLEEKEDFHPTTKFKRPGGYESE